MYLQFSSEYVGMKPDHGSQATIIYLVSKWRKWQSVTNADSNNSREKNTTIMFLPRYYVLYSVKCTISYSYYHAI